MTDKRSAGDQGAHFTTAQPPAGGGTNIRAGLSVGGSLTLGAELDIGPAPSAGPTIGPPSAPGSAAAAPATVVDGERSGSSPSPRGKRARRKAAQQARAASRAGQSVASHEDSVELGASPPAAGNAGGAERAVRIGSPAALLAIVPQLLTFEPELSLVVLGAEPPRGRVRLTVRFDLPKAPDRVLADEIAWRAMGVLIAQGFHVGVAVGYGPGRLVTPVVDAIRRRAADVGFEFSEVLRAEGGRYWSYLCTEPSCCSPDGEPYDVAGHPVTAAFAEAGALPVLASREELASLVAPLDGPEGEAMFQATLRAEDRSARLIAQTASSGRKGSARRLIRTAGLDAVREAIDAYRAGGEFSSDADAAWLLVTLQDLRVRDDAWSRMDPECMKDHLRLWTDLTRRARPGYVTAPASLLAFVAWQLGNGALANVALDRAQADDPGYTMARLLREVIDSGAPPQLARLPMTPEEVAASYAEADEAGQPKFGDAEFGVAGDDSDLDGEHGEYGGLDGDADGDGELDEEDDLDDEDGSDDGEDLDTNDGRAEAGDAGQDGNPGADGALITPGGSADPGGPARRSDAEPGSGSKAPG